MSEVLVSEKLVIPKIFKDRYGHFIGNEWVAPSSGEYFKNYCPIDNSFICEAARGNKVDVEKALASASEAFKTWSTTTAVERSLTMMKVAQLIEDNKELFCMRIGPTLLFRVYQVQQLKHENE